MASNTGKQAIEHLQLLELTPAGTPKDRERQLEELEKMVKALGQGSRSLNQRATTLSALAVAALGGFGIFSAQIERIDPHGLSIAVACLIGIAAFALLLAASCALAAVLPSGKWTGTFAAGLAAVTEGKVETTLRSQHMLHAVKMQLARNYAKATWMKKAYWLSGLALLASTLAVIATLVGTLI